MPTERQSSLETQRAMLNAALVAQCADEPSISVNRLVASLLRTPSVHQFCLDANLDLPRLFMAADDPHSMSYDDCLLRVERQLAEAGIEFGSDAHRASLEPRALSSAIRNVLDPIVEQHGRIAISPLRLLRDLVASDAELANRLKLLRLNVSAMTADSISDD